MQIQKFINKKPFNVNKNEKEKTKKIKLKIKPFLGVVLKLCRFGAKSFIILVKEKMSIINPIYITIIYAYMLELDLI